jgi:hypothetical protein
VIAVFGAASEVGTELAARLLPLLRALVQGAGADRAVLVTSGADAGVVHLLGVATQACDTRWPGIVGVAPSSRVSTGEAPPTATEVALEPHHDVVVLVPGSEWGEESSALFRVIDAVSGKRPATALLVGGGDLARAAVVRHLAADRPLVVLAGSGDLADEIASGDIAPGDDLAVLVRGGRVSVVHVDEGPDRVLFVLRDLLGRGPKPPSRPLVAPLAVWPRLRHRAAEPVPVLEPGFVVEYPLLSDAIHEANRLVVPALHESEATAEREQNRYRLLVVLALAGCFATTVFAALQTWLRDAAWPGVLVAAAGAAAAVLTVVARRRESLDAHLAARKRADRLRSLYFAHLAAPPPATEFDREDRERDLEGAVALRQHEVVGP